MPVQDQDRGVVAEVALTGFRDRGRQGPDGLPGMQRAGVMDDPGQIDGGGTPVLHAVGEQYQPVTGPQMQLLLAVGDRRRYAERQVDGELDLLDRPVAQPQRPG